MSEDAWVSDIQCPQSFNFEGVFSASPRTEDGNPPFCDSAWESDDETRQFFDKLRVESIHRHPSRTQKSSNVAIDARTLGPPRYQHRPTTTFEEYLCQHKNASGLCAATLNDGSKAKEMAALPQSVKSNIGGHSEPSSSNIQPNTQTDARRQVSSVHNNVLWRPPVRKTSQNESQRGLSMRATKSLESAVSSSLTSNNAGVSAMRSDVARFPSSNNVPSVSASVILPPNECPPSSMPLVSNNTTEKALPASKSPSNAPHVPQLGATQRVSAVPSAMVAVRAGPRSQNMSQNRSKSASNPIIQDEADGPKIKATQSPVRLAAGARQRLQRAKSEHILSTPRPLVEKDDTARRMSEDERLVSLLQARNSYILQERNKRKSEQHKLIQFRKEQAFRTFRRQTSKEMGSTTIPSTSHNSRPRQQIPPQLFASTAASRRRAQATKGLCVKSTQPVTSMTASKRCAQSTKAACVKDGGVNRQNTAVQKGSRRGLTGLRSRSGLKSLPVPSGSISHDDLTQNAKAAMLEEQIDDLQSALQQHNKSVKESRQKKVATDG